MPEKADKKELNDGVSTAETTFRAHAPKPEKTPEDLADIALLDALRRGDGESPPENIPLACIVKVLEYSEVPKANEAYAMVRVAGPNDATWRLCIYRNTVYVGRNALFISANAALPVDNRFRNPEVCTVKQKTYRIGHDKLPRLLPHVKRHIYIHNCGVLYPIGDFKELRGKRAGMLVAALLNIDNADELKERQNEPQGKSFQPPVIPRTSRIMNFLRKLGQ